MMCKSPISRMLEHILEYVEVEVFPSQGEQTDTHQKFSHSSSDNIVILCNINFSSS